MNHPPRLTPFNVKLNTDTLRKLQELSEALDCTRSHVVRRALDFHHSVTIQRVPVCGDGYRCLVPHMHPTASSKTAGNGEAPKVPTL